MGIDAAAAQFLLAARAAGVSFAKTATIGKQTLLVNAAGLRPLVEPFGLDLTAGEVLERCGRNGDEFLGLLGAETLTSFDADGYEGASVIHDMNRPVEEQYRDCFSVVFDGGSLEHIFDVRQTMKNFMDMVAVGGHFLGITTANNFMGHGFYQFSPEFFFRVLSPENGFEVSSVMLCRSLAVPPVFYAVTDPVAARGRVELTNDREVYLLAIARKVRHAAVFEDLPQQSDYAAAWEGPLARRAPGVTTGGGAPAWRAIVRGVARRLPAALTGKARRRLKRFGLANPKGFRQDCYRRLSRDDMVSGRLEPRRP